MRYRECDVKINREWEQNTNCDILPTLRLTFPQATQPAGRGEVFMSAPGRGIGGRSCEVRGTGLGLACHVNYSARIARLR